MTKHSLGFFALLGVLAMPASASMQCNLTGVPLQVSSEGLAEPLGAILLQCGGGPPNGVLTGSFQIFVSRRVANSLTDTGNYLGITLSQEFPGSIFIDQPATIRPLGDSILIENFQIVMNAQGFFSLKFGGIRAETSQTTQAYLQFTGNQQLNVGIFYVTVAFPQSTLLATHTGAGASGLGPVLPSPPDFNAMIAARVPMATTRITEGWAHAFVPRKGNDTNGTRIMIRLSGVPEGAKIFAPDAVSGSGTIQPTQSGDMGSYPTSGLYAFNPVTGSLLMSRIRYSAPDGSGGFPAFYPNYVGANSLAAASEADVANGTPYLVYETMDANPSQRDTVQIPIWVVLPTDRHVTPSVIKQTLTLAPLSTEAGSVTGAPIPRFRAAPIASDCALLGDCAAPYFPKMTVTQPEVNEFTAPAGSGSVNGYFLLHNTGASLLEWRVAVRFKGAATGWLTVSPETGFNNRTIRFDMFPAGLPVGRYEGEIVVQQIGAPTGINTEAVVPVYLNVTPPLPPPIPLPSITEILDAANRWPMPEAPGSLIVITGTNFGENTSITIGGKLARIVLLTPTEMLVEVPLDVAIGRADVVPANSSRPGPVTAMDIVPVAPATLYVLNSDDERNSEERPALAGKPIQVFVTGIRGAAQPLSLKIHDRYLDGEITATDQPGVDLVKFIVPDDFPTMPSVVLVCALPAGGGEAACSHPKDIWVKEAVQ